MELLGAFIKVERARKKWSMRELSRQSGVTLSYLSNIENNKLEHSPNTEIIYDLFHTLGVENPAKKMMEFGLGESGEVSLEEKYNHAKRNRMKKELIELLDGMPQEELESLYVLLKEHFNIFELLSAIDNKKNTLGAFETYLEFTEYKEAKKAGQEKVLHPDAEEAYEAFSKMSPKSDI